MTNADPNLFGDSSPDLENTLAPQEGSGALSGPLPEKPKKPSSVSKGHDGENEACSHLASLGYRIVKRNFKYGRIGEIDIIAFDGDTLVFIEVKSRSEQKYGTPESSVHPRKQAQLKRIAKMYFYVNSIQDQACRFDVVAIETTHGRREIRHHKAAFF